MYLHRIRIWRDGWDAAEEAPEYKTVAGKNSKTIGPYPVIVKIVIAKSRQPENEKAFLARMCARLEYSCVAPKMLVGVINSPAHNGIVLICIKFFPSYRKTIRVCEGKGFKVRLKQHMLAIAVQHGNN